MTDTFDVTGDLSPVESIISAETSVAVEAVPNGFVQLGLAPELIQAVADLGYTQPTQVQSEVIPLALPADATGNEARRFIDLMVSSQTGSGKTAASNRPRPLKKSVPILKTPVPKPPPVASRHRSARSARTRPTRAISRPLPRAP